MDWEINYRTKLDEHIKVHEPELIIVKRNETKKKKLLNWSRDKTGGEWINVELV